MMPTQDARTSRPARSSHSGSEHRWLLVAVTGGDGSFRVERPVGKAVVAFDPEHCEEVWISPDQEAEVVFQF
jgi:hypothetical protein